MHFQLPGTEQRSRVETSRSIFCSEMNTAGHTSSCDRPGTSAPMKQKFEDLKPTRPPKPSIHMSKAR